MGERIAVLVALAGLLVTTGGCVPQAKYDQALADAARLTGERDQAQAALDALGVELEKAESMAAAEKERADAFETLVGQLKVHEDDLRGRLATLQEQVADMSARGSREREKKAALEKMLTELQESAADADPPAPRGAGARGRIADLQDEAARLAREKAQLEAEKAALQEKTAEYDALVEGLQAEIEAGQITITELKGKLTVQMSNAILFDSGSTQVKPAGIEALNKVAGVLAGVSSRRISVEGHTDNVPVRAGASYGDNWGLSALRASTVVTLLTDARVDPLNIAAVGFGEHRPVASNDDTDGRAANRRTEIVLVPRLEETEAERMAAPTEAEAAAETETETETEAEAEAETETEAETEAE